MLTYDESYVYGAADYGVRPDPVAEHLGGRRGHRPIALASI
jgi:hypothetical protein